MVSTIAPTASPGCAAIVAVLNPVTTGCFINPSALNASGRCGSPSLYSSLSDNHQRPRRLMLGTGTDIFLVAQPQRTEKAGRAPAPIFFFGFPLLVLLRTFCFLACSEVSTLNSAVSS